MTRTNPPASPTEAGRAAAPATPAQPRADQLLRLLAVLAIVQGGRTWWLDLVKDGKAPRSVKIGRSTFWLASEVQAWIADRVRDSRAGK